MKNLQETFERLYEQRKQEKQKKIIIRGVQMNAKDIVKMRGKNAYIA